MPWGMFCPFGAEHDWLLGTGAVQVLVVVTHAPQVGEAAPLGQVLVRDCAMLPVCPAAHGRDCVCAASGAQTGAAAGGAAIVAAVMTAVVGVHDG